MGQVKLRSEVNIQDQWDLTPIYPNDEAWYQDYEKARKEIKKIVTFQDFLISSKRLLEQIKYDEKISRLMTKLYYYAHLNYDADTTNTTYQKMVNQISDVMSEYEELSSFIVPTFL